MEKHWTKILTTRDPVKAEIIKSVLENEGITVVFINKQDSIYNVIGEIELYCHADNAMKAVQMIKKQEEADE